MLVGVGVMDIFSNKTGKHLTMPQTLEESSPILLWRKLLETHIMDNSGSQEKRNWTKWFMIYMTWYSHLYLFGCEVCLNFVYILMISLDCFRWVSLPKNAMWCRELGPKNIFLNNDFFILYITLMILINFVLKNGGRWNALFYAKNVEKSGSLYM